MKVERDCASELLDAEHQVSVRCRENVLRSGLGRVE